MSEAIRPDGTVLGFDVGARRIGVAVGSAFGHGARALAVVDVHGDHIDWAAIDRLHRHPFRTRIAPPVRAIFATVAPHTPQPFRWIFGHLAVTGPLLAAVLPRLGAETNAMVRTTAVATELSGAPGENVLATTARASVNIRLLTGDTVAGAAERVRRVIADPELEIEVRHGSDPSPVSPWRGEP